MEDAAQSITSFDGRRLPGELVLASTWLAQTNEVATPGLGLPALSPVDWPDADEAPQTGSYHDG